MLKGDGVGNGKEATKALLSSGSGHWSGVSTMEIPVTSGQMDVFRKISRWSWRQAPKDFRFMVSLFPFQYPPSLMLSNNNGG